jgi:hypothetical protein
MGLFVMMIITYTFNGGFTDDQNKNGMDVSIQSRMVGT